MDEGRDDENDVEEEEEKKEEEEEDEGKAVMIFPSPFMSARRSSSLLKRGK